MNDIDRSTRQNSTADGEAEPRNAASNLGVDTRGVQWTLEAFLAVLLLVTALAVVTAVLPIGTQQADTEVEHEQLQRSGDDFLRLASSEGLLRESLRYWNASTGTFVDAEASLAGPPHYTTMDSAPDHPLRPIVRQTLDESRLSYNVHITTGTQQGTSHTRPLVYQGPPGSDSAIASTTVLLRDDDAPAESPGNCTLGQIDAEDCPGEEFYAANAEPTSQRFATVEVRIELWQD